MSDIRKKYMNFTYRMELSISQPTDYLHINIDDCDQSKFDCPQLLKNTKATSGMLKLSNHLTGVIVTNGGFIGDKNHHLFLNCDQFCQDSNKTVSQLMEVLLHTQQELGHLPRKLFFQSDNCPRDLKNQFVLAFFNLLCQMDIFEEILVSHLPIGHTHADVDQWFSIIGSQIRKKELPTVEIMLERLREIPVNSRLPIVSELKHTTNFIDFIKPFLNNMAGHKEFFQFKIRK